MHGFVPGIHVLRHGGTNREQASQPTHVDAWNKSIAVMIQSPYSTFSWTPSVDWQGRSMDPGMSG